MRTTPNSVRWSVGVGAALALLVMAAPAVADPDSTDPSSSEDPSSEQKPPGMPSGSRNNTPSLGAPRLSGTYNVTATYGTATVDSVEHLSSPCGGCNATGIVGPPLVWTGGSWEQTKDGGCGPMHSSFVPTSVVNGYAQTLTGTHVGICGSDKPAVSTFTRIGN